jgi:hypothetical protein
MAQQADSSKTPETNNLGKQLTAADLCRRPEVLDYGEQDENGVDLSLLRYLLQLSPLERLRLMEQKARETKILNEYGRRHREAKSASNR